MGNAAVWVYTPELLVSRRDILIGIATPFPSLNLNPWPHIGPQNAARLYPARCPAHPPPHRQIETCRIPGSNRGNIYNLGWQPLGALGSRSQDRVAEPRTVAERR